MATKLPWMRQTTSAGAFDSATTAERLVYAVGDVHGCADLLGALVAHLAENAIATAPRHKPLLVLLGDYVDRGRDSREVLEFLTSADLNEAFDVCALMGNHEQALLTFLEDPAFGETWLAYGGGATLESYGVKPPPPRSDLNAWLTTHDEFRSALPEHHLLRLTSLEHLRVVGDYAFVHAGIRPRVPLAEQSVQDLLWIREPFLSHQHPHPKLIVHGHTAAKSPYIGMARIGIDTGAYATGILTAMRLYDSHSVVFQARRHASDPRQAPMSLEVIQG